MILDACINVHMYFIGQQCSEPLPAIEEYEIYNCTSGITGVGFQGDTCVISYNNMTHEVNDLLYCQENAEWTIISGNLKYKYYKEINYVCT